MLRSPLAIRMGATAVCMGMASLTHLVVAARMVMRARRIHRPLAVAIGMFQSTIRVLVCRAEESIQFMNCLRCHGLMVIIRLEDAGSSSLCFPGWQCLMC